MNDVFSLHYIKEVQFREMMKLGKICQIKRRCNTIECLAQHTPT